MRTIVRVAVLMGVVLGGGSVSAATGPDPCGGVALDDGRVAVGRPLRATAAPSAVEAACLDTVGTLLGGRAGLRSVTVAVRLSDAERAKGASEAIGARYTEALVAGGVPATRISVLAPRVSAGEWGTVSLTFTEKRAERAVAVIEAVGGAVSAGADRSALTAVGRGARLDPGTWVRTGAGSTAWIGLADGSRLRLSENSLLLIGRLHLDDKLERVVRLELVSGVLEADVRTGGESAVFDISTRFGTAGVRGTRLRLTAVEGDTRLETLEGVVELAATGEAAAMTVGRGQGARLGAQGAPAEGVRTLPAAPAVVSPQQGALAEGGALVWAATPGASRYVVELSQDAEFTYGVRRLASAKVEVPVGDVEAGKWYWRVAAVDEAGYVGPTSKVYAFDLAR